MESNVDVCLIIKRARALSGRWQVEHREPRWSDLTCGPIPSGRGAYLPSSMKSMARVLMMKTHRPAINMW